MRRDFAAAAEPQPIATINITPLIDVMLVLLVTLIITLPTLTHKLPIDLPTPGAATRAPITHSLTLSADGNYSWDGAPLSGSALNARLVALSTDAARPVLMLDVAPATRYEQFDQMIATIKRAGVTRLGFVRGDRWARW